MIYLTAHSKITDLPGQKFAINPDGFHVFAVSWDPDQIIWYVDGREERFLGEDRGNPRAFARAMVDAGADLVVGHGPHVLRGWEHFS